MRAVHMVVESLSRVAGVRAVRTGKTPRLQQTELITDHSIISRMTN
jgi:hypothetical protein